MNKRVYETNSGPILKAIREGKTIIVFLFSYLDSEFLNIHTVLPTLEEASAIYNLGSNQPDWEWDIETTILNSYLPIPLERDWLYSEAPAGLASSLCESLLQCALPSDADEIDTLLNITRGNQSLYDQFKGLVMQANGSYSDVQDCDLFQLLRISIAAEPALVREGILEHGFSIIKSGKQNKAAKAGSHVTGYGVIDTEAANKEMSRDGLV